MAYSPLRVKIPHAKKVAAHYGQEVKMEQQRLTGVTPRFLHSSYAESPARFLPRSSGIKSLAGATKRGGKRK